MRILVTMLLLLVILASAAMAEEVTATIQFGGDVLIHQALLDDAYDAQTDTYDFAHMFAPVAGLLAEADLTVLNLEVPIAQGKYTGYPQFNSPPALLEAIAATGTDLLLCANNHALDRLGKGARRTIEAIEAAGLAHVGTARGREEYNAVPMFDVGGIQVAVFNYTQHTNGMNKEDTEENLRYAVHYFAVHRAEKDIAAAREAGADFVVICVHWGKEYEREASKGIREIAQELCAAGADLIVGGHPHVLQEMEWLEHVDAKTGEARKAFVVYSTGNFLSGQREQYRDTGALFRFTLVKDRESGRTRLEKAGYVPTWVWREEASGRYAVVPIETAVKAPLAGMTGADVERMKEAWAETVEKLGEAGVVLVGE